MKRPSAAQARLGRAKPFKSWKDICMTIWRSQDPLDKGATYFACGGSATYIEVIVRAGFAAGAEAPEKLATSRCGGGEI
jgi:hypothetical protein